MTEVLFSDAPQNDVKGNGIVTVTRDDDGILIMNDTIKGTTMGDPDGPLLYVETLGCKVPTYIDPRTEFITDMKVEKRFQRLNYHVPYSLRGYFKFYDWPKEFQQKIIDEHGGLQIEGDENGFNRINAAGYVLCSGISRSNVPHKGYVPGGSCKSRAVNRTLYCAKHGGGLHLADKKISGKTLMPIPSERIEKLDRVQKFMQGFISAEDLDDDEIQGGFVRNDRGQKIEARYLDKKFETDIAKELHVRLNRFLREKTGLMLNVMVDIAQNDLYEAADRIKAAQWVAERTLGKTPDVVIHGKTDAPYETILDSLESGSRDDYRKHVASSRLEIGDGSEVKDNTAFEKIVDAEFEDLMEGEDEESEENSEDNLGENNFEGGAEPGEGSPLYGGETYYTRGADNDSEFLSELQVLERENGKGNLEDNDQHIKASGESSESSEGQGTETGAAEYAREIEDRKRAAKEQRDRIQKARKRRFAARASGAKTLNGGLDGKNGTGWWLVEFVPINQGSKYHLKLWPPHMQSPAIVRRAEASHAPVDDQVIASQLDAEAARLEARLARLKGN